MLTPNADEAKQTNADLGAIISEIASRYDLVAGMAKSGATTAVARDEYIRETLSEEDYQAYCEARNALITRNEALVYEAVRSRFYSTLNGSSLYLDSSAQEVMAQEAFTCLLGRMYLWDPERGAFSTWALAQITNALADGEAMESRYEKRSTRDSMNEATRLRMEHPNLSAEERAEFSSRAGFTADVTRDWTVAANTFHQAVELDVGWDDPEFESSVAAPAKPVRAEEQSAVVSVFDDAGLTNDEAMMVTRVHGLDGQPSVSITAAAREAGVKRGAKVYASAMEKLAALPVETVLAALGRKG